MRRRIRITYPAALFVAGLLAVSVRAQDIEIKSARFQVESKTNADLSLSIENLRDSPLVAWRIDLSPGGWSEANYFGSRLPFPPDYGPIAGHETRISRLRGSTGVVAAEARLAAAIFADGYCEGSRPALDALVTQIKERTEELTWWVDVLGRIPEGSSKERIDYVAARLGEHASRFPSDALSVRANVRGNISGDLDARPDWWLSSWLTNFREGLVGALRIIKVPLAAAPSGAPSSLSLRIVPSTTTEATARIENLTDKRIEAWVIQLSRSANGSSLIREDACFGDPALEETAPGRGRIGPREVREVSIPTDSLAEPIEPRLTMVLFEDLSFEGRVEDRDSLLKFREAAAEDAAYWSEVLQGARDLSHDRVKAYFVAKRSERAARIAVGGRGGSTREADEAIAALERSPQTFAIWLSARQAYLEGLRARLTRHLKR